MSLLPINPATIRVLFLPYYLIHLIVHHEYFLNVYLLPLLALINLRYLRVVHFLRLLTTKNNTQKNQKVIVHDKHNSTSNTWKHWTHRTNTQAMTYDHQTIFAYLVSVDARLTSTSLITGHANNSKTIKIIITVQKKRPKKNTKNHWTHNTNTQAMTYDICIISFSRYTSYKYEPHHRACK